MKKLTNRSCSRYEDKLKYGSSEICLKAVERNSDWFGLSWFGNFESKFVYRDQGKRGEKSVGASDGKNSAADIFPVALMHGAGTFKNDDYNTQICLIQSLFVLLLLRKGVLFETCVKVLFKQTLVVTNLDFLNIF